MLLTLCLCLLLLHLLTLPQLIYDLIHLSDLILIGFLTLGFLFLHSFSDIVNLSVFALGYDGHSIDLPVESGYFFYLSHIDSSFVGFSSFNLSFNRLQTFLS